VTGPGSDPAPRADSRPDFLRQLFTNSLDPGYEAARPAADRPAWRRRGEAALRLVTLVAIGLLLAVAYRQAVADRPERSQAHAGLVDEIRTAQARTDELQRRSEELRREVMAAQRSALGGASEELIRVRAQEAATGLGAVAGRGVVVELTDAPAPIDPTTGRPSRADVSRVLDVDLQGVVNGLWAAGAEAVAVNGQRLTSTSTIRAAGSAVLVDFRPVTSPYRVEAIGPADLADRFSGSASAATARGLAEQYGLTFAIQPAGELRLPAAAQRSLHHARPPAPTTTTPGGGP
jgi:uncharacterized protein YlxW (UPF0749 family)